MDRRSFLISSAALVAMPRVGQATAEPQVLRAMGFEQQILPTEFAGATRVLGFNGSTPGPELRIKQGRQFDIRLQNDLDMGAAVHWHGIRLDNRMDGVPGMTQPLVEPGETFDYSFTPPDAGTYWYHSHYLSQEQVARGLMGALVIEEETPPDVDHDITAILSDWKFDPEGQLIDDFDNLHDRAHAGRMGNFARAFLPDVTLKQGMRIRLRLINAAVDRIFPVILKGLSGQVVALDGMPLTDPIAIEGTFPLAPAQRADLMVDVVAEAGGTASLVSRERDGAFGLVRFRIAGQASSAPRAGVQPLPPNPLPEIPDLDGIPRHRMTLEGGAMRWLDSARLGDVELSGRELAQLGRFWALNGYAERPDDPFLDATIGSLHRIAFVNETAFPHAMHLHGHHFRLILPDGSLGPWRDTVLIESGETREIALVADNPGNWLLHCHMLGHAASGMMSWFRVT